MPPAVPSTVDRTAAAVPTDKEAVGVGAEEEAVAEVGATQVE